jgi:hypothetical protein
MTMPWYRGGHGKSSTDHPIVIEAPPESATGPDPSAAPHETVAWIRKQMLDTLQSATLEFVAAMRAEGISDDVAARVLNRVTTGVPDPDAVIRPTDVERRMTQPEPGIQAYDQLRGDIQRAAGRHVRD